MKQNKEDSNWIYHCVIYIAIINFALFFLVTWFLGGDALNGFAVGEHYFVSSHGNNTEVSKIIWVLNRLHAASLFITHPAAIISGIILQIKKL